MGKIKYILIGFLSLIMVSCDGLFGVENNVGKPIKFGTTISNNTPKTRTSYSGIVDSNPDGSNTERIYWSDDGKDKVSIYMDWDVNRDGTGYTGKPENGIYSVSPGSDFHPGDLRYGRISYANEGKVLKWQGDFKDNNGRANEYPHTFWSAYPPTDLINGKFTFFLPSDDSNGKMSYAYMAAYEKDVKSNTNGEGHVELHYYPMITTFDVTVNNNSKKNIIGNLKLASENKYISGTYYVRVKDNKFVFDSFDPKNSKDYIEKTIGTLPDGGSKKLMYFIANTDYSGGDLYFSFEDGVKHPIEKEVTGGKKYNIVINVNEQNVEVEEPTFKETIGPGEAQFLILWISNYLTGDKFNEFMGVNWGSDHDWNAFLNKFVNGGFDWNSSKLGDELVGFFTDTQLNGIYEKLLSVKKFETSNKQITQPIHGEFFSLFPQIEEIYIQTYSTVEIPKLQNLEKVTFEYAKEVTISECNSLTSITLKNTPDLEKFTLSKCKSVTTFDMTTPSETWTPKAEYTFDTMEKLSSVKLCSAAAVNVYDCDNLPNANISMKNPVGINRNRK